MYRVNQSIGNVDCFSVGVNQRLKKDASNRIERRWESADKNISNDTPSRIVSLLLFTPVQATILTGIERKRAITKRFDARCCSEILAIDLGSSKGPGFTRPTSGVLPSLLHPLFRPSPTRTTGTTFSHIFRQLFHKTVPRFSRVKN